MKDFIPHPELWREFTAKNNNDNYEFLYKPKVEGLRGFESPTIGIKFKCCNFGFYDEIKENIDALSVDELQDLFNTILNGTKNHTCE